MNEHKNIKKLKLSFNKYGINKHVILTSNIINPLDDREHNDVFLTCSINQDIFYMTSCRRQIGTHNYR